MNKIIQKTVLNTKFFFTEISYLTLFIPRKSVRIKMNTSNKDIRVYLL